MKLTKQTLKRIIKEELDKVMNEEELDEGLFDFFKKKEKTQQAPQQQMPSVPEPTDPNSEPEETEEMDAESREIIERNKYIITQLFDTAKNFLEMIRKKEGVELSNPDGSLNIEALNEYIQSPEGSGHSKMLARRAKNAFKQIAIVKKSMYTDRRAPDIQIGRSKYKKNPNFYGPNTNSRDRSEWEFRK